MKKLLLSFGLMASGYLGLMAQKYDEAKNMMMLQQYDKAKESVDKNWSNPKYLAKPEAYILKASIYAQLGNMPDKGDAGKAMVDEAEGLYQEYLKKDPARSLINDPAYANTPVVLYTNYINRGIAEYNKKDYKKALSLFEKSLFYSSYLNETKIANLPLDTTGQLLAGAAAQNIGDAEHDKIAMSHYKVLADANLGDGSKGSITNIKVGMSKSEVIKILGTPTRTTVIESESGKGEKLFFNECYVSINTQGLVETIIFDEQNKCAVTDDYLTIYRFLARKSFDYEDIDGFKKYMALGKQKYPFEEFFTYEEEDFLFSIEDQTEKLRRIEKKLQTDPNNYKVQSAYGEYLFDLLNPKDAETPLPANYDEIEGKMVGAFDKASSLEPTSPLAVMNLANHFMNKSIRSSNAVADHQKMMRDKQKANTPEPVKGKPAPKAPPPDPADVEKRKELQAKNEAEITKAGGYYESACNIYSKMPELKNMDKQNYRNAVSYLIDINKDLKNAAIRDKNAANEAKYAAAEKKYMDLYASLNK
jgi:tetratricopeptide (TPR) repeat protein